MASDGEINVKIKVSADKAGAKDVEKSVKGIGSAAKKTAEESKKGFEQMQAATGRISGAFEAMKKVLTGFGIGGLVMAVTGGLSRIADSFGSAQKSAEKFRAIQSKLAEAKSITALANDYTKLIDAINAAGTAENHLLEMIDIEVANRRRLDEAKLNAAKEDEIAALDENATDYAEQLDVIEKKYAALKSSHAASNATEDIVLARQKMNAQADQTDKLAEAQDTATKAIQAQIDTARRAKSSAEHDAIALNENDKTGVASIISKTLNQFFTGDWGRMAGAKTYEGDQVRMSAAEKSVQYELQIQKLEEEKRKSEEKAAELRKQSERLRQKAEAMGGQIDATRIEGESARKAADRQETSARASLEKKHKDEAAQKAEKEAEEKAHAAKIADAHRARAALTAQQAQLKAQIAAAQRSKDAAGLAVFNAQGAVDLAKANGGKGLAGAQGALNEAQSTALEVSHSADRTIAALTKTLKDVESRLKATQTALENQSKQTRYAWSEAPAGD